MNDETPSNLLEVADLRTVFKTEDGEFAAVDGVSFSVAGGHTLAIVGESAGRKSTTPITTAPMRALE